MRVITEGQQLLLIAYLRYKNVLAKLILDVLDRSRRPALFFFLVIFGVAGFFGEVPLSFLNLFAATCINSALNV